MIVGLLLDCWAAAAAAAAAGVVAVVSNVDVGATGGVIALFTAGGLFAVCLANEKRHVS